MIELAPRLRFDYRRPIDLPFERLSAQLRATYERAGRDLLEAMVSRGLVVVEHIVDGDDVVTRFDVRFPQTGLSPALEAKLAAVLESYERKV